MVGPAMVGPAMVGPAMVGPASRRSTGRTGGTPVPPKTVRGGVRMLSLLGRGTRLCDGITRREALRVGGLGFTGLMWSDWLRARAVSPDRARTGQRAAGRPGTA